MEISKSTPYVRYRENISSSLHKGTVHIESEYLDRERKTTIESIEGQTWQNVVVQENKEEDLLPRLVLSVDGNTDIIDTKEERMPIDVIHGYTEPVANEDGTYTYEVSTMEGSYAQTYDGVNNIVSSSDGLEAQMSVTYATNEDNMSGSISMNGESSYTITDSYNGEIDNAVLKGCTLVNIFDNWENNIGKLTLVQTQDGYFLFKGDNKYARVNLDDIPMFERDVEYTFIFRIKNSTYDGINSNSLRIEVGTSTVYANNIENGIWKIKKTFLTDEANCFVKVLSWASSTGSAEISLQIVKGDYTNVDIPYFDGMQSVKMPSLMTFNCKNIFNINKYPLIDRIAFGDDGEKVIWTGYKGIENYLPVKSNTIYTFSNNVNTPINYGLVFYDENKNKINYITERTYTFTTPENCAYIRFSVNYADTIEWIQIEERDTATSYQPYEPYKSTTLSTPKDVTLRKIGNVQDTLDLETGVYTQRIGEVVLDGNNYDFSINNNTDTIHLIFSTQSLSIKKSGWCICNKLPYRNGSDDIEHIRVNADGNIVIWFNKSKFQDISKSSIQTYLSQNPLTIQYELAEPTTTQVDTTIKNQDGKLVPKLSTYPTITHINLSSNGLIPSADINYTLLKSTGEASGTSIQFDNGKASDLISGIVYGESLVNALPSPSLKNSMSNTSMQKLNEGYDNINVVDGDVKGATIYGDTLVNHCPNSIYTAEAWIANNGYKIFDNFPTLVKGKTYTFYAPIGSKEGNPGDSIVNLKITTDGTTETIYQTYSNSHDTIFKTFTMGDRLWFNNYPITGTRFQQNYPKVMILEGEWTKESIPPYFEGMQSVVMPSLMTSRKNLFDGEFIIGSLGLNGFNEEKNRIRTTNYIPVESLTTYTITSFEDFNIRYGVYYDKNKVAIEQTGINAKKTFTITTPKNTSYVMFNCAKDDINSVFTESETKNKKVQIEKGNVSTSFSGYHKSTTLTVNEEISLRKIGDVQDELNLSTGKLTQRIVYTNDFVSYFNIIVFDRGFTIGEDYHVASIAGIFGNSSLVKKPTSDNSLAYSNLFSVGVGSQSEDVIIMSSGNDYCYFKIKNGLLTKLGYSEDSSGALLFLKENPIECIMTLKTPTTKTVSTSVVDQDGATQPKLQSYANGYINVQSQGLIPSVNYEVPTNNSYYLDLVKTNTQYTSKGSSDCNATIDGNTIPLSANGTFTTPSTITDNLMVLDTPVNDLMFIEGDLTGRNIDYFTGISSVENPMVNVCGKNLFDGILELGGIDDTTGLNKSSKDTVRSVNFVRVEPNKNVVISNDKNYANNIIFEYDNNKNYIGRKTTTKFMTSPNCYYIKFRSSGSEKQNDLSVKYQVELDRVATSYEPYNGTQLSTTPQITLNGIGDVKDEWDVVNEMVTRKIGKVVLDGSEDEGWLASLTHNTETEYGFYVPNSTSNYLKYGGIILSTYNRISWANNFLILRVNKNLLPDNSKESINNYLQENPIIIYGELATPTTESVRITPQNPQESTTSITLDTALQKVGNVTDQLRWNPYKGHYVRYNYIQDGVASDTYTIENLTSLNERKYVKLYDERTYIDTDHSIESRSYGISIPTIAEQGRQYQVRWDYVEAPSVDTIKVDLCGNVKEIPSTDNSVVIDVDRYIHSFVQIQAEGLTGKITNVMVIETVNGEIPDVDFFSGIQCIGNVVQVDGVNKAEIVVEQTNGNLIDIEPVIFNNGAYISYCWNENNKGMPIKNGKTYTFKQLKRQDGEWGDYSLRTFDEDLKLIRTISLISGAKIREHSFTAQYNEKYIRGFGQMETNGSTHTHYPAELCYADMAKDTIRPRYYDKESFILPQKLCRVGEVYDNLYYDDLKGYYRIQQSIGHKYFMGESSELWNMETTDGYRTIKFTCTNANIDMRAMSATICNGWKHLANINTDTEGFIIYNNSFIIRVDSERLNASTIVAFKEYLASNPIHLFYQLKTPTMVDLTQYPKRIELNTYRDEIFTFLKQSNPTRFILSIPFDKTYRFDDRQEGQGYANRVTITDERISPENVVAIQEVRGQGIANIIEDANNVPVTPQPNYSGKATSHTLNNTKPATINIHGFEPSGDTKVGTYNTTDKAYQIKVMSSNANNSLSDYYVLNLPYQLETYADGTKDKVYYNEAYKEWHFMGGTTKSIEFTSGTGVFAQPLEIFRGLAPRTGMIAEFKLQFDGTSNSSRFYYSLDGVSYSYGSIRNIVANQDIYVAFFNTGGIKLDYATKVGADSTYDNISQIADYIPECLYINQIQTLTSCEITLDKQYIYSELKAPISLETYDGTTKVYMDGNTTDTNIIMNNDCLKKVVNTYPDVEYTVYWKYLSGDGKLTITLGRTKVEVDGTQEYVTVRTQSSGSQELLYVGGYNLSIQDLMVVKGAKIDELAYFENSREIGTIYTDEQGQPILDESGRKQYLITLIQGGNIIEKQDKDSIIYTNNKKHNTIVTKILGVNPIKID